MSRNKGKIGENFKCYILISKEEQMKPKPFHFTGQSRKLLLHPVEKFPQALGIIKDPIFLITRCTLYK